MLPNDDVCGMEQVQEDILLIFWEAPAVSATFLSYLGQLQHRSFLKHCCFPR